MKLRAFNLLLRASTLGIKFVLILVLAAFMSPEEVGLYGLIAVTVSYSTYLVGFEFYTYSTREIVSLERSEWPGLLASQLVFFLFLYVIVLPLLIPIFKFDFLPWEFLSVFLLLVVSEHLSAEIMRLLVVIEKTIQASALLFIKQALWVICFLVLIWVYPSLSNLETLLFFWLAGSTMSIVFGVCLLRNLSWNKAFARLDLSWVRRGLVIALPLLVSSLAVRTLFTVDRYFFEALNGEELLGAYTVYMGIAAAILSFMDSGVFVFYYPKMMKHFRLRCFQDFWSCYRQMRKQSLIFVAVLSASACALGFILFPVLKERVYEQNMVLFVVIVAAITIFVLGYIFQYALYSTGNDREIIQANVFGVFVFFAAIAVFYQFSAYWAIPVSLLFGCLASSAFKGLYWERVKRNTRALA